MKITKKELREVIQEVAEEMGLFEGLTAAQEKLPEPLKKAILKKQESDGTSDDSEDVEEGLTKAQEKLPEPLKKAILKKQESDGASSDDSDEESIEEGNAFGAAVKNARDNGEKEFEVGGKKYKLKEKKEITEQEDTEEFIGEEDEDDVEEGNAFGAAVTKAKEDGDKEFEVDGKTYKVSEDWSKITEVECPECGQDPCVESSCSEEDGDTEIEVEGKSYKVRENWTKITLAEKLNRMLGNRKVL